MGLPPIIPIQHSWAIRFFIQGEYIVLYSSPPSLSGISIITDLCHVLSLFVVLHGLVGGTSDGASLSDLELSWELVRFRGLAVQSFITSCLYTGNVHKLGYYRYCYLHTCRNKLTSEQEYLNMFHN